MGIKHGKPVLGERDLQDIADTSGMDHTKVKQKFDDFVSAYPNGKVRKKYFKTLMSEALLIGKIGKNKDKMGKLANHIFRVYDSNNDGYIDFVEFMIVYNVMSEGEIEDVFGKIFRLFDVNGDGYISMQEMQRLVKDLHEFVRIFPDEIVMGVFKEMDNNQDNKISKEEFITACLANGGFTKLVAFKAAQCF